MFLLAFCILSILTENDFLIRWLSQNGQVKYLVIFLKIADDVFLNGIHLVLI